MVGVLHHLVVEEFELDARLAEQLFALLAGVVFVFAHQSLLLILVMLSDLNHRNCDDFILHTVDQAVFLVDAT